MLTAVVAKREALLLARLEQLVPALLWGLQASLAFLGKLLLVLEV